MNAQVIENQIQDYMLQNSGLEQHRDYLGMSKIAGCPRQAYREYFGGVNFSEESYRMCYTGYEQEALILNMLMEIGVARPLSKSAREVVAQFDSRLKGHIDGETVEGDLLEVKSVSYKRFQKIRETGRALSSHYVQVQLYMLHGRWKTQAFLVYRCRDTYEHIVLRIPFLNKQAVKFNERAIRLLKCIDTGVEPECECGRCIELDEYLKERKEL